MTRAILKCSAAVKDDEEFTKTTITTTTIDAIDGPRGERQWLGRRKTEGRRADVCACMGGWVVAMMLEMLMGKVKVQMDAHWLRNVTECPWPITMRYETYAIAVGGPYWIINPLPY
ncbi:unnamed protein product [Angiostrongylus costaricensis]|uniref:Uncharacterized protein n=1 Tax=Angiostrongylus costaricensis TaxID=334426 RepID=A0A0R3PC71_ANGCS|nr:unnamed protein product [Angiostrongylus costaricensis]